MQARLDRPRRDAQPGRDAQRSVGASLKLDGDLGRATLVSTTSYADSDIVYSFDADWGNPEQQLDSRQFIAVLDACAGKLPAVEGSLAQTRVGSIYEIGTLARVLQLLKLPDGTVKVLVEGLERADRRELDAAGVPPGACRRRPAARVGVRRGHRGEGRGLGSARRIERPRRPARDSPPCRDFVLRP